jgi:hypothetical protein
MNELTLTTTVQMQTLGKLQIGQCGVLFLQFKLLLRGIESAPMTTDSGIDLVLNCKNKRQNRWLFKRLALLLTRHSPLRGCFSLAPRQPPKWPAASIAYFCNQALVAYSPKKQEAVTIQVKTKLKPGRSGGRGRPLLNLWMPEDSPAQYGALVDLDSGQIWLFSQREIAANAQQHSNKKYQLYFYIDENVKTRTQKPGHAFEFKKYLLENRLSEVFGV